jgi:hypothetical protein
MPTSMAMDSTFFSNGRSTGSPARSAAMAASTASRAGARTSRYTSSRKRMRPTSGRVCREWREM